MIEYGNCRVKSVTFMDPIAVIELELLDHVRGKEGERKFILREATANWIIGSRKAYWDSNGRDNRDVMNIPQTNGKFIEYTLKHSKDSLEVTARAYVMEGEKKKRLNSERFNITDEVIADMADKMNQLDR